MARRQEAPSGADREAEPGAAGPGALAAAPLAPGVATALGMRVHRVLAPNPGVMTGPGTNTYVVRGEAGVAVIDPGPEDVRHLEVVAGAVRRATEGLRTPCTPWVLVTHTHIDHAPGARKLTEMIGGRSAGYGARDGFFPGVTFLDGETIDLGGTTLHCVHTPGHASNHLCYVLDEERLLFSGDHVMGGSTVVIAPPDGDMAQYVASLERLRDMEPAIAAIAPGHGPALAEPHSVLQGIIDHRLAREAAVAAVLTEAGSATIDGIVAAVYTDVPEALHPIARFSVWAHLRKLAAEGRASSAQADTIDGRWHAGGSGSGAS